MDVANSQSAVTDEGWDGECCGKAWVATCGVGEAKKRNDLCGDFFFSFDLPMKKSFNLLTFVPCSLIALPRNCIFFFSY